jgi:broad specificity phosphatase PhoE
MAHGTTAPGSRLFLIRHGETEWSASGRHTGWTDIPLSETGVAQAERLGERLAGLAFDLVLSSPLARALDTCRIAGLGDAAVVDPDLREWDYGEVEGRTTDELRTSEPDWSIWTARIERGESVEDVGRRVDRVIARALAARGDVALFGHGHGLRILGARWLGLEPAAGSLFELSTATVSRLGWERERRVIELWNEASHLDLA